MHCTGLHARLPSTTREARLKKAEARSASRKDREATRVLQARLHLHWCPHKHTCLHARQPGTAWEAGEGGGALCVQAGQRSGQSPAGMPGLAVLACLSPFASMQHSSEAARMLHLQAMLTRAFKLAC